MAVLGLCQRGELARFDKSPLRVMFQTGPLAPLDFRCDTGPVKYRNLVQADDR